MFYIQREGSENLKNKNMRNRDLVINKIENIEGFLKTLRFIVERREPIETYLNYLNVTLQI